MTPRVFVGPRASIARTWLKPCCYSTIPPMLQLNTLERIQRSAANVILPQPLLEGAEIFSDHSTANGAGKMSLRGLHLAVRRTSGGWLRFDRVIYAVQQPRNREADTCRRALVNAGLFTNLIESAWCGQPSVNRAPPQVLPGLFRHQLTWRVARPFKPHGERSHHRASLRVFNLFQCCDTPAR